MIHDNAIRINLIQALPGQELVVASNLMAASEQMGLERGRYFALKVLGGFDVFFVYETQDNVTCLTDLGPIQGMLKYSQLLSFGFNSDSNEDIFSLLEASGFIGFSLIKLDPDLFVSTVDSQRKFSERVQGIAGLTCVLGTLGWNEYLVVNGAKQINEVLDNLLYFNCDRHGDEYLMKTCTYVCIKLDELIGADGSCNVKEVCDTIAANKALGTPIADKYEVSVRICASPNAHGEISKFYEMEQYDVNYTFGATDIVARPFEIRKITWASYLCTLFRLRDRFKSDLHSTQTTIGISDVTTGIPSLSKVQSPRKSAIVANVNANQQESVRIYFNETSREVLAPVFGPRTAAMLEAHNHSLFSLLQHPIVQSAFWDMEVYPLRLISIARRLQENKEYSDAYIAECAEEISNGAELRAYGIHGNVEVIFSRFPNIKGGVQRSLQAIEHLPAAVFSRFGSEWDGFINVSEQMYYHLNEIIVVPIAALWDINDWWAIYHEIGHVIVERHPTLLHEELPEVQNLVVDKLTPKHWVQLLSELSAEVIGFEIGFFNDFELYSRLLWQFLYDNSRLESNSEVIETYLVRTFYVYIFEEHFRNNSITRDQMHDEDYLFRMFTDHIEQIELFLKRTDAKFSFPRKIYIAANNVRTLIELYPVSEHMISAMRKIEVDYGPFSPPLSIIATSEYLNAVNSLRAGEVPDVVVKFPEAIIYMLAKIRYTTSKLISFKTSIATILTLWGQQVVHMQLDLGNEE